MGFFSGIAGTEKGKLLFKQSPFTAAELSFMWFAGCHADSLHIFRRIQILSWISNQHSRLQYSATSFADGTYKIIRKENIY